MIAVYVLQTFNPSHGNTEHGFSVETSYHEVSVIDCCVRHAPKKLHL